MIEIEEKHLMQLIHWARRYCDGRATYSPTNFNEIYACIQSRITDLSVKDDFDPTLTDKGRWWPYAQDGMYDPSTGSYDAMIRKPKKVKEK